MLRIVAALCLIATTLAACGGDSQPTAAKATAKPPAAKKPRPDLCKEINEAFEDNEGAYFSATALDYLAPDLIPLVGKLQRAKPEAAAYARRARALVAAGNDRSLPRVRAALAGLRKAAESVEGCRLRPTARDLGQITAPFYVNILELDYLAVQRASEGPRKLGPARYVRLQRRVERALGRALARLDRHAPPPRPVRKVARRYIAAATAYRSAIRDTIAAVLSGSHAMYLRQHRDETRARRRFNDAHIDVSTLL